MSTVLENLDRQKESNRRRGDVQSATVSFQLEGIEPTPEFLQLAERYINLEIDGKEFRALGKKLH